MVRGTGADHWFLQSTRLRPHTHTLPTHHDAPAKHTPWVEMMIQVMEEPERGLTGPPCSPRTNRPASGPRGLTGPPLGGKVGALPPPPSETLRASADRSCGTLRGDLVEPKGAPTGGPALQGASVLLGSGRVPKGVAIAFFFSPTGVQTVAACSNAADGAPVKRDSASGNSLCHKGSTTVIFFAGAEVARVADLWSMLRADARGRAWADLDDTLPGMRALRCRDCQLGVAADRGDWQ